MLSFHTVKNIKLPNGILKVIITNTAMRSPTENSTVWRKFLHYKLKTCRAVAGKTIEEYCTERPYIDKKICSIHW